MNVAFIDCDSYQVSIGGRHFRGTTVKPEFRPPEHQGKESLHDSQSEAFSVAVLFFQCLMLGRHPYDQKGGTDQVANIKKGYFPYGKGAGGIPEGPWYKIWSHMPHKVKALFIQTFKDCNKNRGKRPSLGDWKNQFHIYLSDLRKDYHNSEMMPATAKSSEYHGTK